MTQTEFTAPEFQKDRIHEIKFLLQKLRGMESDILSLEERLAAEKAAARELSEVTIPDLMREVGITELKFQDGSVAKLDKVYVARIPERFYDQAMDWLRETNNDGIVKEEVTCPLDRGEREKAEELVRILQEHDIKFSRKMAIHPSTLRKFVREHFEEGKPFPKEWFGADIIEKVKFK